ncbi:MAG: hypothetical protein ACJAX4_000512 [Clostridium sp.]|jgi:hypothetical protein
MAKKGMSRPTPPQVQPKGDNNKKMKNKDAKRVPEVGK